MSTHLRSRFDPYQLNLDDTLSDPCLTGSVAVQAKGSLVDRALACLATRSMSTPELAERVLALKGNASAAAAAVYVLLGSDRRFRVDGSGTWSLASRPSLSSLPFAATDWVVVDVETTGGSPSRGDRIIEIAAVHVSRNRIVGEFSSLVNPGRPIPRMITSLTGITEEAVRGAPHFEEVLPELTRSFAGRVFVGHNAGFDWRFVCAEMERCTGRTLTGRRLCTLRLARRLLPHLPSRSLGALAEYIGVEMQTHHRALDDAAATAHLLIYCLRGMEERGVTEWSGLEPFLRRRVGRKSRRRRASPVSMDRV